MIDTSTDFRAQALREGIKKIDAVLYTHPHQDHIAGIDELRAFTYAQRRPVPAYMSEWTLEDVSRRFEYVLPQLQIHPVTHSPFSLGRIKITPLPVIHGPMQNYGYRIESVAYLTDVHKIPDPTLQRMRNLDLLVLDCIQLKPHHSHLHLDRSLEMIADLKPKKAVLTHMNHTMDYPTVSKKLPKGVQLAYDGLKIKF